MILQDGEKKLLELHKHWFRCFSRLWYFPVIAVLPAAALYVIPALGYGWPLPDVEGVVPLVIYFYALWILLLWVLGFIVWTDYYLDAWIITPERVIDINQKGVFHREVSSVRFERIQDVMTDVEGVFPTLMDYGTLRIQSAGEEQMIRMEGVRNPYKNKQFITDQLKKVMEEPEAVRVSPRRSDEDPRGNMEKQEPV